MTAAMNGALDTLPHPLGSAKAQFVAASVLRSTREGERNPEVLARMALLELTARLGAYHSACERVSTSDKEKESLRKPGASGSTQLRARHAVCKTVSAIPRNGIFAGRDRRLKQQETRYGDRRQKSPVQKARTRRIFLQNQE